MSDETEEERERREAAIRLLDGWIAEDEAARSQEPPPEVPPLRLREVEAT